ncbi:dihydrofolate reductase family protein [Jeotgalibacillus haloalkalitolerans]|uniref:Dihydrofolate reductase family protein n=1 Tax=Jeotgalibacillus haloalkalitolerans TaxID=3104292 RepID=A0ABU5KIG3_9BACL|nr:dihydrofolate reductase family protein [Jeotgalibacillus sp. HH7-29]MDZ5710711.1 dihydrofolate reductase family protein [Jeotgalibacillus sp. HH7-29]
MRKLIYHVATTVDGYIAHTDGSADTGFLSDGEHVTDYIASLQNDYGAVIMGRATYEYGYQFGLEKGSPAYQGMPNYVFSSTLDFPTSEGLILVKEDAAEYVANLKKQEGKPVYLCGGGRFASYLLNHQLIDEVILKVNPVLFGAGIKLFEGTDGEISLELMNNKVYSNGVLLPVYQVNY